MRKFLLLIKFWARSRTLHGLLAILLAVWGLGRFVQNEWFTDVELLRWVEADLQSDFEARVQTLNQLAADTTQAPPLANLSLPSSQQFELLGFGEGYRLKYWNTRNFVPNESAIDLLIRRGNEGILTDKNWVYYAKWVQTDSLNWLWLLPLRRDYPIQNDYLPDYQYLGRWEQNIRMSIFFPVTEREFVRGARVVSLRKPESTELLFAFSVRDTSELRRGWLQQAFWGLFLAWVYGLFLLRSWLLERYRSRLKAELIVLGVFVGVRLVLLLTYWTTSYFQLEVFSSSILALNALNPSIGDLTLNAVWVLWMIGLGYRYLPITQAAAWLKSQSKIWVLIVLACVWAASVVLFLGFFGLFDSVVANSKIYFEFANFFKLDVYSYLVFLNLALLLTSLFLFLYWAFGLLLPALQQLSKQAKLGLVAFAFLAYVAWVSLLASGYLGQEDSLLPWVHMLAVGILFTLRQQNGHSLAFGLLPALALFTLFAGMTNLAVSFGLEKNTRSELQRVAERFAEDKDLITESTFDGVMENIRNDSTLWHTDTLAPLLPNPFAFVVPQMINRHLVNAFKQYDVRVFVYSGRRRLDNQFDVSPFPLSSQLMRQGRTLSQNLYQVPSRRSVTQSIYVGRVPISSMLYGRLILQIELHPKNLLAGKLYPELLLDQNIRKKLTLPTDYSLAIYVNQQLSRKEGGFDFPLRLTQTASTIPIVTETDEHYILLWQDTEGKVIHAIAPKRTSFDKLTSFSFLFYFFVGLYLLLRTPVAFRRVLKGRVSYRNLNFTARIQLYLVVLTLLPLVAIWFFTTPLFERFYYEETQSQLRSSLQQLSGFLEGEGSFLAGLSATDKVINPTAVDLISRVSDILFTDINVYDTRGALYITTRPKIYQLALISSYINPEALRQLRDEQLTYLILDENLGSLTYFSGYVPLMDAAGSIRGYLNIPFLSRQDVLRNQIRKFIAYLINVYVVLILTLVLASLLISKSITNPLRLLKQRLDETQVGRRPEPLAWSSADEIGAIIASYNEMLAKLELSEKRLAKSEREGAWREMARQVAHEIKNPLTPMKLTIQHLVRILESSSDEKAKRAAQKISGTLLTQIDSLTAIANSFSQFATLGDAKRTPMQLEKVLQDVHQLYAETEGLALELFLPEGQQVWVYADANQLNRVFVNLIRNAAQAGATVISVRLEILSGQAIVAVADNGNGIPEEIRERVFEPNFSTKTSGMGLGLAITRRIIETTQGSIWFESQIGAGTTFFVSLPIWDAAEAPPSPILPSLPSNAEILPPAAHLPEAPHEGESNPTAKNP